MIKKVCKECGKSIKGHPNRKRCLRCAEKLRKHPKANLSRTQIKKVKSLVGKKSRNEISKITGIPISSLTRFARDNNLRYFIPKYSKELINQAMKDYLKGGIQIIKKKYPKINTNCFRRFVKGKPRQKPWNSKQLKEVVKMAGIIPNDIQAIVIGRPNANAGSIKSVWTKKFKTAQKTINGLYGVKAKYIADIRKCPSIPTTWGVLYLWRDLQYHLCKGLHPSIVKAIRVLAEFQTRLNA